AGVEAPAGLDAFLRTAFEARRVDFTPGGPGRYTERDGRAVVEKWRQRFTPEEVALIRRETEELAAAFGYDETHWTDLPAGGRCHAGLAVASRRIATSLGGGDGTRAVRCRPSRTLAQAVLFGCAAVRAARPRSSRRPRCRAGRLRLPPLGQLLCLHGVL